jgi:hypothetical protein
LISNFRVFSLLIACLVSFLATFLLFTVHSTNILTLICFSRFAEVLGSLTVIHATILSLSLNLSLNLSLIHSLSVCWVYSCRTAVGDRWSVVGGRRPAHRACPSLRLIREWIWGKY